MLSEKWMVSIVIDYTIAVKTPIWTGFTIIHLDGYNGTGTAIHYASGNTVLGKARDICYNR